MCPNMRSINRKALIVLCLWIKNNSHNISHFAYRAHLQRPLFWQKLPCKRVRVL